MNKKNTNIYLQYFVKETQPENLDHLPKNSSEEYKEIIHAVSRRKLKVHWLSNKIKHVSPSIDKEGSTVIDLENAKKDVNILLHAITNDSIESIKHILDDYDINSKDHYLWTPLMCACHRGDVEIVRMLLNKGAKIAVKDAANNTPLSIAKSCDHLDVLELILKRLSQQNSSNTTKSSQNSKTDSFKDESLSKGTEKNVNDSNLSNMVTKYVKDKIIKEVKGINTGEKLLHPIIKDNSDLPSVCLPNNATDQEVICLSSDEEKAEVQCSLCNVNIVEDNYKNHLLSTVHQFYKQLSSSEAKAVKPVDYSIPEENKGFQMLLKSGWSKQHGLGKQESGIKVPIRTKIKNDKKGIGKVKQKLHKILPEENTKFNPKLRKKIEKSKEILFREALK